MPELPEVQTVVDTLSPAIVGQRIKGVDLLRHDILSPVNFDLAGSLVGQSVQRVSRRGKRIVIKLSDQNQFFVHLGMTGRLTIEAPDAPLLLHTHLLINFETDQLRFRDPRRFGGIWWLGTDQSSDDKMGPEPLGLRTASLAKQLSRTTRAIKSALLDQSVLAGLGNIYADESLFASGIHPLVPANELDITQIARLNRGIKSTLKKAIRHNGSTLRDYFDANGNPGGFQKLHAVYDRAKMPCRKCKTPIERLIVGGRSTHFCPSCQHG